VTEGIRLALAFALAATLTAVTIPAAIAIARRTGFFDSPAGYKSHSRPTPYLGGLGVLAAAVVTIVVFDGVSGTYGPLLAGTLAMLAVGTIDDKVNLSPFLRVGVEALAAWYLWSEGLGWTFLDSDTGNLLLTIFWVTGIVNAFNLMDNLDGAAGGVTAVSAVSAGVLAAIGDDYVLALMPIALGGAALGFLRFNLARPSRIFLGDGGSMAIGFLLAGALMVVPMGDLSGWSMPVAAALMVGLPVFDTTLVVASRLFRGAPVFSGATDHTTHRLLALVKTPHAVCLALVAVQSALSLIAIEATRVDGGGAVAMAFVAILVATASIAAFWGPTWTFASDDS
jgi:UDP-GlcNAc:undecaprenyl-phosphate GlcNAc-1-phosphate transferase